MSLPPTPPLSTTSSKELHPKHHPVPLMALTPSQKFLSSLSLPKVWLDRYSAWVLQNASSVSQIESALRSLNYIIPSRIADGAITAETYHSSVQLLSLYHDSVLLRAVAKLPGMPKMERPLNRYTKFWTLRSRIYRRTALLLQCVRYTELLWEMAVKRRGERVRWRVVVALELLKAICRLILLRVTGGRMLVPPLPERDPPPEAADRPELSFEEEMGLVEILENENDSAYGSSSDSGAGNGGAKLKGTTDKKSNWFMPRTGMTLPKLPDPDDISTFLMKKVLTAEDIKPATNLLSKIQGSAQIAEILYIIRPVIYTFALARVSGAFSSSSSSPSSSPPQYLSTGKSSWKPFLLALSIDLLARQLRHHSSFSDLSSSSSLRETTLEKEEWSRRGWNLGWYALRGPMYENVTERVIDKFVNSKWVPGLVGGMVADYAGLWGSYYFATSD